MTRSRMLLLRLAILVLPPVVLWLLGLVLTLVPTALVQPVSVPYLILWILGIPLSYGVAVNFGRVTVSHFVWAGIAALVALILCGGFAFVLLFALGETRQTPEVVAQSFGIVAAVGVIVGTVHHLALRTRVPWFIDIPAYALWPVLLVLGGGMSSQISGWWTGLAGLIPFAIIAIVFSLRKPPDPPQRRKFVHLT